MFKPKRLYTAHHPYVATREDVAKEAYARGATDAVRADPHIGKTLPPGVRRYGAQHDAAQAQAHQACMADIGPKEGRLRRLGVRLNRRHSAHVEAQRAWQAAADHRWEESKAAEATGDGTRSHEGILGTVALGCLFSGVAVADAVIDYGVLERLGMANVPTWMLAIALAAVTLWAGHLLGIRLALWSRHDRSRPQRRVMAIVVVGLAGVLAFTLAWLGVWRADTFASEQAYLGAWIHGLARVSGWQAFMLMTAIPVLFVVVAAASSYHRHAPRVSAAKRARARVVVSGLRLYVAGLGHNMAARRWSAQATKLAHRLREWAALGDELRAHFVTASHAYYQGYVSACPVECLGIVAQEPPDLTSPAWVDEVRGRADAWVRALPGQDPTAPEGVVRPVEVFQPTLRSVS